MQSGRIAPVFRQFFNSTLGIKNATDSHSQQRQEPEKEPEREPGKEEALEALDRLTQQDEFQKNALRAELRTVDGRVCIFVFNAAGTQLRVMRGSEILRLLDGGATGGHRRGQILDRRV
jgi:hypothetical protein